jgi:hypothetical protein
VTGGVGIRLSASGKPDRSGVKIERVAIALLQCVECGATSNESAGWRVVRIDDPEEDAHPELGWYCPRCSVREFGKA